LKDGKRWVQTRKGGGSRILSGGRGGGGFGGVGKEREIANGGKKPKAPKKKKKKKTRSTGPQKWKKNKTRKAGSEPAQEGLWKVKHQRLKKKPRARTTGVSSKVLKQCPGVENRGGREKNKGLR